MKRAKCQVFGCPAFASPAGTGLCSYHDSLFTKVGEKVHDPADEDFTRSAGSMPTGGPPVLGGRKG